MGPVDALERLSQDIVACRKCPRLVAYRKAVARGARARPGWTYWAKPVPGFGDPQARLLVVGLAPAAHGANRTGRMFTGDLPNGASVWLVRALYRAGFANQPTSLHREDGLHLLDAYLTAAVRCAPPQNRPLGEEFDACFPFLEREFRLLPRVRVVVALGQVAYHTVLRLYARLGVPLPRPRPPFTHGALYRFEGHVLGRSVPPVLCTFHPSRQNTNTGRLTERMLDRIFGRARQAAAYGEVPVGCVVAREGRIIARAHDRREGLGDPTAHAEILAIREAARFVGSWRLEGCTLAVTIEPCAMCAGAIVLARVARLVYGAPSPKSGAVRSLFRICEDPRLNHRVEVVPGVLAEEAARLLQAFFDDLRRLR